MRPNLLDIINFSYAVCLLLLLLACFLATTKPSAGPSWEGVLSNHLPPPNPVPHPFTLDIFITCCVVWSRYLLSFVVAIWRNWKKGWVEQFWKIHFLNDKLTKTPLVRPIDNRTDVWSQDFMIWRINFGLWAVAWAEEWEKRVWADYEQLLRPIFSLFRGQKNFLKKFKNILATALKSYIKWLL